MLIMALIRCHGSRKVLDLTSPRRKRKGITHHATFSGWSLNGVDASQTVATLAVVLHGLHVRFKSRNALPRLKFNLVH